MRVIVQNVSKMKKSAGIRVMNYLAYYIKELGYETYVLSPSWDEFNIPVFKGEICDTDIVIYPEIVKDNPLKAKNVVIYGLYYINHDIDSKWFVINYQDEFKDNLQSHHVGENPILTLGSIEPNFFKPAKEKDLDSAIYIGKGMNNWACPYVPPRQFIITEFFPPQREDLADFLGRLKILYTYDFCTALIPEALLSGCKVYLVSKYSVYDAKPDTEKYIAIKERDMQSTKVIMDKIIAFFHL